MHLHSQLQEIKSQKVFEMKESSLYLNIFLLYHFFMQSIYQRTVEILADLVSFPVLGGESNLSILQYIQEYLDSHEVAYQLVPNQDGSKASLFARIGPAVDGGIILSGHMDVVPVEGQDWKTEPFVLTQIEDKLYARGSADMKGFVASCLANVPYFKSLHLEKPIYFAFSYDEEVGCLSAPELVKALLDFYEEKPAFAWIGEPTVMQPMVGQKGICVLETTVYGSAGHSSRIRQEVSAIHEAAKLVVWIENKMHELVNSGHLDNRFTPPHSSLHVGVFRGGIAPNVISDVCTFQWDVRTIPSDKLTDILADFQSYCTQREEELKLRFAGARIVTTEHHPPVPPLDTPEDQEIVSFIRSISPIQELGTVSYAAEAGQFAEAGLQAIICGPGDIAQAHRANEFIEIKQLELGLDMLHKLGQKLAHSS